MEADIQRAPCRCTHHLRRNVGRVCFLAIALYISLNIFRYDEGTAFMPIVPRASQLPVHPDFTFLALDADGYDLPSDWYMRIAGYAAEGFHGERVLMETFPVKELQDYWSSRPHYVDDSTKEEDDRRAKAIDQAYKDWEEAQAGGSTDDAPPPYSLEELVEQTQAMALSHGQSSGSGTSGTVDAQRQSDPAPPIPSRNPSLSGSVPTSLPPSRHHSVSAATVSSSSSPPALPARAQSVRPAPVNLSSHPSVSGRPPPLVNASARPRPPSVNAAARPPTAPTSPRPSPSPTNMSPRPTARPIEAAPPTPPAPSMKPHSHFSSEYAAMPMPSVEAGGAGWPGGWHHHHHSPTHSASHTPRPSSGGRPHSPLSDSCSASYMPSPLSPSPHGIGGPHDPYAAPYPTSGGFAFPAPMHAGPDEYAYPNQSVPEPLGPYMPYHYGGSPHSHSPPPPALPPRRYLFVLFVCLN